MNETKLNQIRRDCLITLLSLYKKADAGHIGSSLSCLDILVYLYFQQMKPTDKFVLSKGHAAVALYTLLAKSGYISEKKLQSFYQEGTLLAAHPPCSRKLKGVIFGTGSLGHGLSLAAGLALSTKYSKKRFKVYCLISEGDCNEGSTWEAALFAAHHHLDNLWIIIDYNKIQAFGRSEEVLNLNSLKAKWRAFNFDTIEIKDGHDFHQLEMAFKKIKSHKKRMPKCLIANTVKGHGVSYMEDKLEWHYWPMSDEQYNIAVSEIKDKDA